MTVEISGTLFDEGGNALANVACVIVAVDDLIGQSGGARVKRGVTATTSASGVLTVDLEPGRHILYVNPTASSGTTETIRRFAKLTVLTGETSMTLQAALDTDVGDITASTLQLAQQAADAAAASLDAFEDQYLGDKASDPVTDNDGDPLTVGALYFNTTSNEMRVWDGSAWDAAYASLSGGLLSSNNLGDVNDPAASLANLGLTATTAELNKLDGVTISTAEINYLDGVTSGIQGQLDNKISRNAIINGNFDHWQRGTSLAASAGFNYLADRWASVGVGSTIAPSRQAFALGQTGVPNEPEYFHRCVVSSTAGASNQAHTQYRVEDVRTFAGQTATFSFWAKADSGKDIAVEFTQNFGTGGSPSAEVTAIDVTTCSLTTSWQKFTVTVSFPSLSGKILGTDDNDRLGIIFYYDAGSDFNARTNSLGQQSGTFDIAQVQLEAGSVATPFERRPVGTELALCQRYFYDAAQGSATPAYGQYFYSGGIATITNVVLVQLPVTLRVVPSITIRNVTTSGAASSISSNINNTANQTFNVTTGGAGGGGVVFNFTADSEL